MPPKVDALSTIALHAAVREALREQRERRAREGALGALGEALTRHEQRTAQRRA